MMRFASANQSSCFHFFVSLLPGMDLGLWRRSVELAHSPLMQRKRPQKSLIGPEWSL